MTQYIYVVFDIEQNLQRYMTQHLRSIAYKILATECEKRANEKEYLSALKLVVMNTIQIYFDEF